MTIVKKLRNYVKRGRILSFVCCEVRRFYVRLETVENNCLKLWKSEIAGELTSVASGCQC